MTASEEDTNADKKKSDAEHNVSFDLKNLISQNPT